MFSLRLFWRNRGFDRGVGADLVNKSLWLLTFWIETCVGEVKR